MMDQDSKQILALLDSDSYKLQGIADELNVSLDKVKRVSRVRNIRLAARNHLNKNEYLTLISLGFKALTLAPLLRDNDWPSLSEVLQNASKKTTREDLSLLMLAVEEKQQRIEKLKESMQTKITLLENEEKELISTEKEVQKIEKKILQETAYLQKYEEKERKFLLEHLGIFENRLVLSKRLDFRWQALLKKKEILQYDKDQFVWRVLDLDALAKDYSKRVARNYATIWEYERELKRNHLYSVPDSPNYKRSSGLAVNLQTELKEIEQKKANINNKKRTIQKEITTLRKESPQSFFESVQATALLSPYELKEHAKLQEKALKRLYQQEYVTSAEVTLPNNQRADVIGYNREGKIIIIEVKVNREDFLQDKKWQGYLPYCHEFYFLLNENIFLHFDPEKHSPSGLLVEKGKTLTIEKDAKQHNEHITDHDEIVFSINQNLSRKLIYGY